jgi:hypothetical protein
METKPWQIPYPNTENIGSITLISDEAASPDMNFIDPIFSVLGQLYSV